MEPMEVSRDFVFFSKEINLSNKSTLLLNELLWHYEFFGADC